MLQTGLGFMEILVIVAALLLLFGPKGMSELVKDFVKIIAKIKVYRDEFTSELMSITDDVVETTNISDNPDLNLKKYEYSTKNKDELRKIFNINRLTLRPDEVNHFSNLIFDFIDSNDTFIKAKNVFCYISVKNEVQTSKIISKCLSLGKNVYVPWCKNNTDLKIAQIKDPKLDLKLGKFDIPEPIEELRDNNISLIRMDLIIIPGVAFDLESNRIGQGKGYFDKFIDKIKGMRQIWALAFDTQISKQAFTPTMSDTDIKPDLIITETRRITDYI